MGKSHKIGTRSKVRTLSRWGRGLWRRAEHAVAETAEAEAAGGPAPGETAGGPASSSTEPAGRPAAGVAGRPAPEVAGRPAPEVAGRPAPRQEAGRPAPAAWCAPEYWVHSEDAEQTLNEVYRTLSWRLHEGYADYAAGAAAHSLVKRREGQLEPDHWAFADPDLERTLKNYLYDHPSDGYTGRAPRLT